MMKEIQLTKGKTTTVDDCHFEELNSFNWYASGHDFRAARRLKDTERKLILIYHQILCVYPWELRAEGLVVDHIDGDPSNNCVANLRVVSYTINARNTLRHTFRQGFAYDGTHNKWKAYLDLADLPRINIGTYLTKELAQEALAKAKREHGIEDY